MSLQSATRSAGAFAMAVNGDAGLQAPGGLVQLSCPSRDPHSLISASGGEALAHSFPHVRLFVGSAGSGDGLLLITTRRLLWQGSAEPAQVQSILVQLISLHAVSSETPLPGKPGLFLQLAVDEHADPAEDEAEQPPADELYLVPDSSAAVQEMFQALCEAAALNPDPESEEDDQEPELFFNEQEVLSGADADQRAAMLQHFDSLLQEPGPDPVDQLITEDPDRFEDADGEEEDDEAMPEASHHQPS